MNSPSPDQSAAAAAVRVPEPAAARPEVGAILSLHVALTALFGFVVTVIWGVTGAGGLWPAWAWLGLAVPLALHAGVRYALHASTRQRRRLALHGAISGVLGAATLVNWSLSGGGYFWPVWPLLGLGVAFAVHGLWEWLSPASRERELAERVDVLTRTRRARWTYRRPSCAASSVICTTGPRRGSSR